MRNMTLERWDKAKQLQIAPIPSPSIREKRARKMSVTVHPDSDRLLGSAAQEEIVEEIVKKREIEKRKAQVETGPYSSSSHSRKLGRGLYNS